MAAENTFSVTVYHRKYKNGKLISKRKLTRQFHTASKRPERATGSVKINNVWYRGCKCLGDGKTVYVEERQGPKARAPSFSSPSPSIEATIKLKALKNQLKRQKASWKQFRTKNGLSNEAITGQAYDKNNLEIGRPIHKWVDNLSDNEIRKMFEVDEAVIVEQESLPIPRTRW